MTKEKTKKFELTPMMQRYVLMKEKYKDTILFYRLGDFYEMFFEDAELVSRELGITLTGKDCGLKERAPMCGVPFHAYENYVAKLINKGYKVAICEQVSPVETGKLVEREVVRIITPGTVIDESMTDDRSNAYIMSIYQSNDTISFAYADISTGEFCVSKTSHNALSYINDQVVCVAPAEIICNAQMHENAPKLTIVQKGNCAKFNQYYEWEYGLDNAKKQILSHYKLNSLEGYDFNDSDCIKAIGSLLAYLLETQKRDLRHLNLPRLIKDEQYMYLDDNTRRNLELESRMKDGSKSGTLLWVLDKTNTGAGARLLRTWLNKPLQRPDEINARLNCVEFLFKNPVLRASLSKELSQIYDIERIVARLAYGTISPREFNNLAKSIAPTIHIKEMLQNCPCKELDDIANSIKDLTNVSNSIFNFIVEEPPALYKDGGYIQMGIDSELDRLRNIRTNNSDYIKEYQIREQQRTGIKGLKVGYNRVFGYYIEVSKLYSDLIPMEYVRKQTISNNERYITEELKKYENEVLTSNERAIKLEAELYDNFKQDMMNYCADLQQLAYLISQIDCFNSLATVAVNNNYCKPQIVLNNELYIKNGRHPVIEILQRKHGFIENDTSLDAGDNRTMILTGPNMAGKSTYMRQVALITLMAHIGSFVPASEAQISIVDRIFTRIGASDDLAVGQSTFMVEMVEVSNILTFATNKSLIILDEVGRGTSTHDGMSIASAVVEYLSKTLNCKTLFATHYHELMHLEGTLDGVKNYCISIKEINGELVFLRKIMRGSATRSYGIEVASLAGIPKEVITRAKEILADLEKGEKQATVSNDSALVDTLKSIDVNSLSPMLAFDTLIHLIDLIKE
ncbi:MAG: DNA mismatch repair protein MutS [Clostridia bacterium]|nr:DNA mismatch repair protein MutS [Clostridia bacterium]